MVLLWGFQQDFVACEKKTSFSRDKKQMVMFRETLENCCLVYVAFFEPWFTWEKGNLL